MANEKPTAGRRAVSINISPEHHTIIRNSIEVWRDGAQEDLENADTLPLSNPDESRRLLAVYGRVLDALDTGRLWLPDPEARKVLEEAQDANVHDAAKEIALNNAHRALLAVFDGAEDAAADGGGWTTRDDDLAMESAVLQQILEVHPASVTGSELVREMFGETADFGERDAVERAARDLGGIGLVHYGEDFVAPTRAALRFQELIGGGQY
jgi:hypothetical protein